MNKITLTSPIAGVLDGNEITTNGVKYVFTANGYMKRSSSGTMINVIEELNIDAYVNGEFSHDHSHVLQIGDLIPQEIGL